MKSKGTWPTVCDKFLFSMKTFLCKKVNTWYRALGKCYICPITMKATATTTATNAFVTEETKILQRQNQVPAVLILMSSTDITRKNIHNGTVHL
jgi:hypothetical protein